MPAPPVYLDECVDAELAVRLEQRGFAATTAEAQGTVGATDAQQLAFAVQHGWIILTHNRRHFQREHHNYLRLGRSHSGILVLPQRGSLERLEIRAAMMLDWLRAHQIQYQSALYIWNDLQVQLTQGLQLPGYTAQELRRALGQEP
jgi:hypothetical protein